MVVKVEVETEIPATSRAVWAALVDFSAYEQWHPNRAISGEAAEGARVLMTIRGGTQASSIIPAVITEFNPGGRIVFRTGRRLFGYAYESYELVAGVGRTRLVHRATLPTVAALPLGGPVQMEARLKRSYAQMDGRLRDHVLSARGRARLAVRGADF